MRVEVRAAVFVDGRLVVTEETRQGRPHSALPGGRVNRWESVHEALVREVREETGLVVEPGRLLYVAEVVEPYKVQDVNLVFLASVTGHDGQAAYGLVDPARADGILPPVLADIARDAQTDWRDTPRWLGNLWVSSP